MDGGVSSDTLIGGTGNDIYIVNALNGTIVENVGGGTDTINAAIDFSLAAIANVENLTLTSSAISGIGNSLNNTLTTGNSQNNILDGGAGSDTLIGGTGNDTYIDVCLRMTPLEQVLWVHQWGLSGYRQSTLRTHEADHS